MAEFNKINIKVEKNLLEEYNVNKAIKTFTSKGLKEEYRKINLVLLN